MSDLDFEHEEHETGGSKRPTKVVLKGMHPEHGQVGHLTYHVPRRKADKIYVDRLEVQPKHQGNGYASQLMDEMQRRHPGTPIDHGDRTDDGKGWWAGYTKDKKVTKGRTMASKTATERPHTDAVYRVHHSRSLSALHPALEQSPGDSPREASETLQGMLRHLGHPDASYAFVMRHPKPEHGRSTPVYSEGEPGVALHPQHWTNEYLAHEAAHLMENHVTNRSVNTPIDDHGNHGPGFQGHLVKLLNHVSPPTRDAPGAGDEFPEHLAYHSGKTAVRKTAAVRMVPPEEYAKFHYPDYPKAKTPAALVKHFKKTSPEYYDKVKKDVQANGFSTPILVKWNDQRGKPLRKPHVMEGHHRAAVAHELGIHLPVGDYDDNDDHDNSLRANQAWFSQNERPSGDMPGTTAARRRCPCGTPVMRDGDEWVHADGSISHEGDFYGKSVADLMRTAGAGHPFIHVSPREFKPGDKIEPADDHGGQSTFDYSDLDRIYLSHPDHAEYWGNTVGAAGGHKEVHHYEVEPHEHPEFQISSDNEEEYTSSGATVKRKLRTQKVDPRAYTKRQIHPSLLAGSEGWGKEHDRSESQYAQRVPSWEKNAARTPSGVRAISLPSLTEPCRDKPYLALPRREASKEPNQRLFGPTFGLDHRLFEGEHLRPAVRAAVVAKFDDFATRHDFDNWRDWGRLVFFGSEASEWTSKSLEGNGDFDLSFGIDYPAFRKWHPHFDDETDAEIARDFTDQMHAELNDPNCMIAGEGPFDQTWFCNEQGYDIAAIKPYSAYDVGADSWIVKPPHLPDWDLSQFPEGHALVQEARAVEAYVRAVLRLPEPYRSQQATALWEHLHSDRGRAFGPQGEGWFDPANVIEKWLDQRGVWQKLVDARMEARDHPEMLATPSGWSNDPHGLSAGRS